MSASPPETEERCVETVRRLTAPQDTEVPPKVLLTPDLCDERGAYDVDEAVREAAGAREEPEFVCRVYERCGVEAGEEQDPCGGLEVRETRSRKTSLQPMGGRRGGVGRARQITQSTEDQS